MSRLGRIDARGIESFRSPLDEPDTECDEMSVPVIEPGFGGGPVQYPVRFVVATVHVQVQLEVGDDIRARIPPVRVESDEDPGHLAQEGIEARRVGVLGIAVVVTRDEEIVGRHVLEFAGAAQRTGDEKPQQSALEVGDVLCGQAQLRQLTQNAEKLAETAWELAGEYERRFVGHRRSLGYHPPDVVHDGARSRHPGCRSASSFGALVDRNPLEEVPDVEVVRGEEAEAVLSGDRPAGAVEGCLGDQGTDAVRQGCHRGCPPSNTVTRQGRPT